MNEKITAARQQLGGFFKERREQMGISPQELAASVGVTANTIDRIEIGRFSWDIDVTIRLCYALSIELMPVFTQAAIEEEQPILIGNLNKRWGLKGYDVADAGHPVYSFRGKYIIHLTHPTLPPVTVPFNKGDLTPIIDFL